jgi:DNA polymerase-3 subunit gamma/tau
MELDAASRTGVDNIRELQEVVSYAPVRDRYRVLIIDEAHMLSKAAFNALLKTLEEPPPHVVFVLATTELQRLLPTILSRCQAFEFHRVSVKDVSMHLRRVADAEKITISGRTLDRIARAGDGSVRDALSVLERVLAFCGMEVSDEEALQVLGSVRTDLLTAFVKGFADRDAAALLAALDALVDEGHDFVHFWGELVGVVRDLMLLRAWPQGRAVLSRAPEEASALAESGRELSLEDLTRIFQILAALELPLKSSSQPRFLFEGALIRIAGLGAVRPIEEILASLREAPPAKAGAAAAPLPKKKHIEPVAEGPAPVATTSSQALEEVRSALVLAVSGARPMLGAMIDQAASITIDGGTLRVVFGPGGEGVRRMLSSDENARTIERLASETLGRPLVLSVGGPTDGAAEAEPPAPATGGDRESRRALMERAARDPDVQLLLREFGAQIIDARSLSAAEDEDRSTTIEETT